MNMSDTSIIVTLSDKNNITTLDTLLRAEYLLINVVHTS